MESLELKRERQKKLFNDLLKKHTSSTAFKKKLESALGKGARMVQYSAKYKHQALQILAYQFSSIGNTNHAKVLMLSVADHYKAISHELDHFGKTGLGAVILDKNNNVCWIQTTWDHCDLPSDFKIKNAKYRRKYEICSAALESDQLYQKMIGSCKYGEVLYFDKNSCRPDLNGKGLRFISPQTAMWRETGYKYAYSLTTNPITIKWGNYLSNSRPARIQQSTFDFSDFVFSDGSSIHDCYKALEEGTDFDVGRIKKENSHIGVMMIALPRYKLAKL